uniref:Sb:cb470 n=1 Tax=Gasterosteus aculeatus aculeatus TaxID=481459 RepID=A0AAQ4Q6V6_GASAC
MSRPYSNPFQSSSFKRPSHDQNKSLRPSIFSTLKPPVAKSNNSVPLFNDCISAASSRTQEYLLFKDPEDKFHPSPDVLNITDTFNCTAMTPEQRILLGADWVWAMLEKPTKNPKIQIAVQVLHLDDGEEAQEDGVPPQVRSESVQIAHKASSNKTMYEKMVGFCTSIGKDCYALFLFFGKKSDKGNIYGVLSNNFEAAIGKCDQIDRDFIENFFKGSRTTCLHVLGINV